MKLRPLSREQWRSSLRTAFAALITAALTLRWSGATSVDLWYGLYGVARSNLADQRLSVRVARERILGTLFGGVIGTLLLLLGPSWALVGVAYLLVEVLGRHWGFSAGSRVNATVVAVLLFLVPADAQSGPYYVFFRTLWHLLGLSIGMLVEHLFWSRDDRERWREQEAELVALLRSLGGPEFPAAVESLERKLVEEVRRMRQLAELLASQDPDHWGRSGGQERLTLLETAAVHGAALVRRPASTPEDSPLARRCADLDREALLVSLGQLQPVSP